MSQPYFRILASSSCPYLKHCSPPQSLGFLDTKCQVPSACVHPSRGWGFCLDDRPSKRDLTTPLARLGVRYTTHHQCQLQYGPNATFCHEVDVSIVRLRVECKVAFFLLDSICPPERLPDSLVLSERIVSLQTGLAYRWHSLWTREGVC